MTTRERHREQQIAQWMEIVQECRSSGQTATGWCNERGISTKTYYRWEKRVLQRTNYEIKRAERVSAEQKEAEFAELTEKKEEPQARVPSGCSGRKTAGSNSGGKGEHYPDEAGQVCPECGSQMSEIGREVRRSLVMIPAQVKIREDVYYTYSCRRCKKESTEAPVVKAKKVPAMIPGSYASPEAIAHIMVQKFVMGSPLYRQEQERNRAGAKLSRQTMSSWILGAAELAPASI